MDHIQPDGTIFTVPINCKKDPVAIMKKLIVGFFLLTCQVVAFSQKVFTEGVLQYDIQVKGEEDAKVKRAFSGANMVIWFKASRVRVDYNSNLLNQTTLFDAKDGSVVLLKESGSEKYMMNLTRSQWAAYNHKYEGISYKFLNDIKTVGGFVCKKAVGTLSDGSELVLYYCPDLLPYTTGYDYAFIEIPGLVLEYEVAYGNMKVIYTASKIQTSPVSVSKFDLPRAGYKILEFNQ